MKTVTRSEALELLRTKLARSVDEEHSLCQVAARTGALCRGFKQWTFGELKQRFDWIARKHPRITRKELEVLANRWMLARQFVHDRPLACDAQQLERQHRICEGWGEFDESDLARHCTELLGEEHLVVPDPPARDTGR